MGDVQLNSMYDELIQEGDTGSATLLYKYIKKARFDQPYRAAELDENQWTQRLSNCLQLPGFQIIYSARFGREHHLLWRARLPNLFDERCFLFRGVPDIVFRSVKFDEVTMVGSGRNSDESSEAESDMSDHSARCEMGNKNEKSYARGSSIVEKGGELVASMHLSLVCQALRRIVHDDDFTEVSTHGLLIHRQTSVAHFKVTLGLSRLHVEANILVDGYLTKEVLCNSFHYLTGVLQHK